MSFSQSAARAARVLSLALTVAFAAGLGACGTDGGVSSDLPPGDPTTAGPGNSVIYVAMSAGSRIDAYRLGADGLLPSEPFDRITVKSPRRLALEGNVLYAALRDKIVSMQLGPNGELPSSVTGETSTTPDNNPIGLIAKDGILYCAYDASVQSFELDENGDVPADPTGAGTATGSRFFTSLALSGRYLYAGARDSARVELFLLDTDGNVPDKAEPQSPHDDIGLPDDIVIRDGILYVTSSGDKSLHAYKIKPDGFLPGNQNSRTMTHEYYSDIAIEGDTLYAAAYNAGHVDLYTVADDGMLPLRKPFAKTQSDPSSYPAKMIIEDGIIYVAQAGLGRVDAYVLDPDGNPSRYPSSSTGSPGDRPYPLDLVLYRLP